jgi:hypothetical protein
MVEAGAEPAPQRRIAMPKKHPTLITLDNDGDHIEMVRLTSGAKELDPVILPNRHLDARTGESIGETSIDWVASARDRRGLFWTVNGSKMGAVGGRSSLFLGVP